MKGVAAHAGERGCRQVGHAPMRGLRQDRGQPASEGGRLRGGDCVPSATERHAMPPLPIGETCILWVGCAGGAWWGCANPLK